MSLPPNEALARFRHLARGLGPLVSRGPLQQLFVSPTLPEAPVSSAEIGQAWTGWAAAVRAGTLPELLNLYLHIPFCSHRCRYCIYHSTADHTPDDVARYVDRLRQEITYYAELLGGLRLSCVYLGGGTPTVLAPSQLRPLLEALQSGFGRRPGGSWTFECNPLTATPEGASLFAEHGFNRVSFGVQSLRATTLEAVNRGYQTVGRVEQTLRTMQALDLWINVDLIHGLPGESPQEVAATATRLLELGATELTVYQLSPYTPQPELRRQAAQSPGLPALADILTPALAPLGATVSSNATNLNIQASRERQASTRLVREQRKAKTVLTYDDITMEPYSLLGIGPTARSTVYATLSYRMDAYPAAAPLDPEATLAQGRPLSLAEERRRFVSHHLWSPEGLAEADYVALFAQPLAATFGDAMAAAKDLDLLVERNGRLHLAPGDSADRFAAALFFVDEDRVQATLHALVADGKIEPLSPSDRANPAKVDLLLATPRGNVVVRLVKDVSGRPSYHAQGGYAFFEPRDALPERRAAAGLRQAILTAFRKFFSKQVDTTAPQNVQALATTLQNRGQRLRLTSPQQPGRSVHLRITSFQA